MGVTITLTHLAPYVKMSQASYYKKYMERGLPSESCQQFALEDIKREIADAVQTFNYQINSMSTTNG